MTGGTEIERQLGEVYAVIEGYYSGKISRHGAMPRGVDWESEIAQEHRFAQLLALCNFSRAFSLNDIGCGYGALNGYLAKHHADTQIDYLGIDLSAAMIRHAKPLWRNRARTNFLVARASPRVADYSVASGIFNVKLDQPTERWERFVARTLADMHRASRIGFAVNFLAPQARGAESPSELYRTPPGPWLQHCRREFGWSADLLRGYGLREFTLVARR